MPVLARAIYMYHDKHGELPMTLGPIAESVGGRGACRLPANIWEDWDEHSGPEILYLPIQNWDGQTEYVIAGDPWIFGPEERAYIVSVHTTIRRASDAELAEILVRDDELRAKNNQPGRWSEIPWQTASKD